MFSLLDQKEEAVVLMFFYFIRNYFRREQLRDPKSQVRTV